MASPSPYSSPQDPRVSMISSIVQKLHNLLVAAFQEFKDGLPPGSARSEGIQLADRALATPLSTVLPDHIKLRVIDWILDPNPSVQTRVGLWEDLHEHWLFTGLHNGALHQVIRASRSSLENGASLQDLLREGPTFPKKSLLQALVDLVTTLRNYRSSWRQNIEATLFVLASMANFLDIVLDSWLFIICYWTAVGLGQASWMFREYVLCSPHPTSPDNLLRLSLSAMYPVSLLAGLFLALRKTNSFSWGRLSRGLLGSFPWLWKLEPHPRDALGAVTDIFASLLRLSAVIFALSAPIISTPGCYHSDGLDHDSERRTPTMDLTPLWYFVLIPLFVKVALTAIPLASYIVMIAIGSARYVAFCVQARLPEDDLSLKIRRTTIWGLQSCLNLIRLLWSFSLLPLGLVLHTIRKAALSLKLTTLQTGGSSSRRHGNQKHPKPEQLFRYGGLKADQKEIRLIKISKGWIFSAAKADLITVSLERCPDFEAVSYTWGGQAMDQPLRLEHGGSVMTTKNVCRIIDRSAACHRVRLLWIDALCINQDDPVEKMSQIRLMGDIYRRASRVLAWLDYEDISLLDMALMHILNRALFNLKYFSFLLSQQAFEASWVVRRMWIARAKFLTNPYWTRGWIIQEVALADRLVFIFGGQMLDESLVLRMVGPVLKMDGQAYGTQDEGPHALARAAAQISRASSKPESPDESLLLKTRTQAALLFLRHYTRQRSKEKPPSLGFLLTRGLDFDTTEPRDKVLCLLGMLNEIPPEIDAELREPSSTLSLFTAACRSIGINEAIEVSGIGYPGTLPGWPSWIPNWHSASTRNIGQSQGSRGLEELFDTPTGQGKLYEEKKSFTAGIWQEYGTTPRILQSLLVAEGIEVSAIDIVSEVFPAAHITGNNTLDALHERVRQVLSMLDAMPQRYPHANQSSQEALWRTLIEDRWPEFNPQARGHDGFYSPAPAGIARHFECLMAKSTGSEFAREKIISSDALGSALEALGRAERFDSAMKGLDFACDWILDLFGGIEILQSWQTKMPSLPGLVGRFAETDRLATEFRLNVLAEAKRVAVTSQQHWCVVPPLTRAGDKVFVLAGLERPVVLRSVPGGTNRWQLVGSCYVHGIMFGEMGAKPGGRGGPSGVVIE